MIDPKLQEEAYQYVKKNIDKFYKKFADLSIFLPVEDPFSIFMAGSPGAGKTEFSVSFDPKMMKCDNTIPLVRIDPDEIKTLIPYYTGKNTDSVQRAATLVADKLYDFIQKNYQSVIVDTTFADLNKAEQNIKRAIDKKRRIGIVYIYQDPLIAWKFTKAREIKEGRPIPKEFFINAYYNAKENVNLIKEKYGRAVEIILVEKDFVNRTGKTFINIDKIDYYIKLKYNKEKLKILLT